MDKFLTCYDYGSGGVWRYVIADSAQQILTKYPELEIVDAMPKWMTKEMINRINELTVNIEDNKNEFLNALMAECKKK